MTAPGLTEALERATGVLDDLDLRYALVGGLAVGLWALPRATRDVDLWVEFGADPSRLAAALERARFDVPAMDEELRQFGVFRARDRDGGVFVDMFEAVGPLGDAILENRRSARLGALTIWLASETDLAVLKAYSDRARDFDDLIALLAHADVDMSDLEDWARRLDASIGTGEVSERVQSAAKQAKMR